MRLLRLVFFGVFCLCSGHAFAQVSGKEQAQRELNTLPSVGSLLSPGASVSFDASSKGKEGTASIVFKTLTEILTVGLSATGKVSEDSGEAEPLDLRGLGTDASAKLSFNWFVWRAGAKDPSRTRGLCLEHTGKPNCDDSQLEGDAKARFLRLSNADSNPWTISLAAEVGRSAFEYLQTGSITKYEDEHNDWAIETAIGNYMPTRGFVSAEYKYKNSWDAASEDKRQICSAVQDAPGLNECVEAVLGPPTKAAKHTTTLQWRKFFRGGHAAINPTLTRDFTKEKTQFSIPVLFFADDEGGLTGGVRASWKTGQKGTTIGIFIGTALSIMD